MRKADDAVRYAYRSWPRPDEGPVRYMIRESGTDAIGVYGVYRTDYGDFFHVAIKAFPFASSEKDDIEFAIREAEELIEKLRE